jgi:hypothetical protein
MSFAVQFSLFELVTLALPLNAFCIHPGLIVVDGPLTSALATPLASHAPASAMAPIPVRATARRALRLLFTTCLPYVVLMSRVWVPAAILIERSLRAERHVQSVERSLFLQEAMRSIPATQSALAVAKEQPRGAANNKSNQPQERACRDLAKRVQST